MDLDAALNALARQVGANITMPASLPKLTAIPTLPLSIPEPAFVVAEVELMFDETFGRALDAYTVTCRALVGATDDLAASRYINLLMAGSGPTSLKQAIQSDKTLGGTVKTLHVRRIAGRRMFQWAGETEYLGVEILLDLWGAGNA